MSKKRYKILITEEVIESRPEGGTWTMGAGETSKDWGYTPQIIKKTLVSREIFTQNVPELDLKAVIFAVNNISTKEEYSVGDLSHSITLKTDVNDHE